MIELGDEDRIQDGEFEDDRAENDEVGAVPEEKEENEEDKPDEACEAKSPGNEGESAIVQEAK